jgi:hypothetical protein
MNEEILIEVGQLVINTLIERKVVSYTYLRNEAVKRMFRDLKSKGIRSKEARSIIEKTPFITTDGRKYFLTDKNIQKIIYADEPNRS